MESLHKGEGTHGDATKVLNITPRKPPVEKVILIRCMKFYVVAGCDI
jgi:hypothetical protein